MFRVAGSDPAIKDWTLFSTMHGMVMVLRLELKTLILNSSVFENASVSEKEFESLIILNSTF